MRCTRSTLLLRVRRPGAGDRTIPIGEFHHLPGDAPEQDTNLEHGELIVAIDLPKSNFAKNSHYLKVRDRASYAFALVAVAAALDVEDRTITEARIVLGSVAHMPWRSRQAEAALVGQCLIRGPVPTRSRCGGSRRQAPRTQRLQGGAGEACRRTGTDARGQAGVTSAHGD